MEGRFEVISYNSTQKFPFSTPELFNKSKDEVFDRVETLADWKYRKVYLYVRSQGVKNYEKQKDTIKEFNK